MSKFELYNGSAVVPVRRPLNATWRQADLPPFGTGLNRRSVTATVEWSFPKLTEAQLLTLTALAGATVTFKTFRPPSGATPSQWLVCTGILQQITEGAERQGWWYGVVAHFDRVEVV